MGTTNPAATFSNYAQNTLQKYTVKNKMYLFPHFFWLAFGFEVNFTDGSEGVYYFDINLPEPASLPFGVLPMLLTTRRRL